MLKLIHVDNFKCLVNFELVFQPLSLLLGGNGVGKSTVFEVIRKLRGFISDGQRVVETFPASSLTRWQKSPLQSFRLELVGPDAAIFQYELVVGHDIAGKRARVENEILLRNGRPLFEFTKGNIQLYREDHSQGPIFPGDWSQSGLGAMVSRENQHLDWFKTFVHSIVVAGLQPYVMTGESASEADALAGDGSNFASWFRYLSQEYQDRVFELTQRLRSVLPGFHAFRLSQAGSEYRILQVGFVLPSGGEPVYYRFDELSDGQRALIVLNAVLFGAAGQDQAIFLDEPENYLALQELQPWLMDLQSACGNGNRQAVLISHHPEFIDMVGERNGIWLARNAQGMAQVRYELPKSDEGLRLSERIERGWLE